MSNDVCLAASENLRVIFERCGDRWAHRIELRLPDGGWITFSSDEGDAEDIWPPSPPLQSLELQKLPDGRQIAFLVGMAGASHWSAAIEAHRDTRDIFFDIACRCATQPARIGSQYRVELPADVNLEDAATHFSIRESTDGHQAALICDGRQLKIHIEVADAFSPCTIRWRYVVANATR